MLKLELRFILQCVLAFSFRKQKLRGPSWNIKYIINVVVRIV